MGDYIEGTAEAISHMPQRMVDVTKAAFGGGSATRRPDQRRRRQPRRRRDGHRRRADLARRIQRVLVLLAGLNLFLALFNFIPLLPLDGGHIAGALYEAVRRGFAKLRGRPDPGYVDVAKHAARRVRGWVPSSMLMSVIL